MPSERNEFDRPREYQRHRDLIQDPEILRERIASSRDDERNFQIEEQLRQNYSASSTLAKFALIASAATIVKNSPMAFGRTGITLSNKVTSMINHISRGVERNYLDVVSRIGAMDGRLTYDESVRLREAAKDIPIINNLRIFDDLNDSLNLLFEGNYVKPTIQGIGEAKKNNPVANSIIETVKEKLAQRHSAYSSAAEGIQGLTVDDIINMSTDNVQRDKVVNLFGKKQVNDLQVAKRIGLVDGAQRIDTRIFLDKKSQEVLDARILSPKYTIDKMNSVLSQVQIPFVNLSLQDIFSSPLAHLFDRGGFAGIVRDPESLNPKITSLAIGDTLYKTTKEGLVARQTGVRIGKESKLGEAVLARRGQLTSQLKQDTQTIKAKNTTFFKQFLSAIQEDVGVGRKFATREAVAKSVTVDLVKRISEGKPVRRTTTLADEFAEEVLRVTDTLPGTTEKMDIVQQAINRIIKKSKPDVPTGRSGDKAKRFRETLLALAGDEEKIQYVKQKDKLFVPVIEPVKGLSPEDIGVRPVVRGAEKLEKNILQQTTGLKTPNLKDFVQLNHYSYDAGMGSRILDVTNFMTTRLNDLIGASFGIGFRPTQGSFGFAGNLTKIFGMAAAGVAGYEAIKYADYLGGIPTGGYKPSTLLLDIYGAARITAQFMREFTGLSPAARYMEDLMPGSIESSGSGFIRTIAPIVMALKKFPSKKGAYLGIAGSLLLGEMPFSGLSDTPKETIDKLYGEELVPMRSGRYWMLGKQPFEGGKIQYFAPSMFARMRGEYKYTETLYGSQAEYFRNISFLPTPSNLFRVPELVGNVLSPLTNIPFIGSILEHAPIIGNMFEPTGSEYLAQKHAYDRPYPTAFSMEQLSNRTVSNVANQNASSPGLRAYSTPMEAIKQMNMAAYPATSDLQSAESAGHINTGLAHVSELAGLYKFALWDAPFSSSLPAKSQMADPGYMNSITRAFYDESVGGLMGHTELLRRFILSDYNRAQREATNTIPNTMPVWLPGTRSSFVGNTSFGTYPGDRNYHIDFTLGDPYSKIPHGEFRLPGAAREQMFRLHSGSPGVYDAVDRFMVLADVAPNSEAYKHYKVIVESQLRSGVIDDYWTDKISKTKQHVSQKMKRYETYSRKFDGISFMPEQPEEQAQNEKNQDGIRTYYTLPEQLIGNAWEYFAHDVVKKVGVAVPILGPMLSNKLLPVRDELDGYLKREVYDTDEYDWSKPFSTMLRPMHEQLKAADPFTATAGGYMSGLLFGANPLSRVLFSTAGAMYFGGASSMRAIETGKIENGYIPGYVQERRRMDEYFDNLEYIKYRRLENQAKMRGLQENALHFADLKKRTVASLDYSLGAKQFVRDALIALPTREKQFFTESLDSNPEEQQEVLRYIPEYLKPVYQAAWAKQDLGTFDYSQMRRHPDTRAAHYFMGHGMPDPTWAGFHPDVPMEASKIKTAESAGVDMHRMGIFDSSANKFRYDFPSPDMDVFNFYKSSGYDAAAMQQLEAELMMAGITDVQIDQSLGIGSENLVNYNMNSDASLSSFFGDALDLLRS